MMCRIGGLEHHEFEMLITVQLLHAVLDEVMTSISTHPTRVLAQPSFLRLPLYKFPCATCSWIGALGRWLSHECIDNTKVTSKAAKRDDAAIATNMWNKRLILLYPHCSVLHRDVLRTWLLCRVRRRVLRELCMYFGQRFGGGLVLAFVRWSEMGHHQEGQFVFVFSSPGGFRFDFGLCEVGIGSPFLSIVGASGKGSRRPHSIHRCVMVGMDAWFSFSFLALGELQ
jgi:hypothetical protein